MGRDEAICLYFSEFGSKWARIHQSMVSDMTADKFDSPESIRSRFRTLILQDFPLLVRPHWQTVEKGLFDAADDKELLRRFYIYLPWGWNSIRGDGRLRRFTTHELKERCRYIRRRPAEVEDQLTHSNRFSAKQVKELIRMFNIVGPKWNLISQQDILQDKSPQVLRDKMRTLVRQASFLRRCNVK